jgi:hypothetical protein
MPHFTDISMKNFSTVSARLAVAALFTGLLAAPVQAAKCDFRANAPDQHKVVKGDTLWDISGTFLEHPWCWPQVWGLNKDQIKDPHWIYPGQIIYFDRVNGRLSLNKPGSDLGANGNNRLQPQLRTEGLGKDAISSISSNVIEPFLSQPLIIEGNELNTAPRVVASQDGHVNLGKDDKVYVRGNLNGVNSFQVFRPGAPLRDPVTRKVVAIEAVYLGSVKVHAEAKPGSDVHTMIVSTSKQEIGIGDRLLPAPPTAIRNYIPHAPDQPVDARVLGVYSGVNFAGQNEVISINRGSLDGIDVGTTLQIYTLGKTVPDTTVKKSTMGRSPLIKLPDEQNGTLFIFRVFNHVSYGLIMQVTEPVQVGDVARSPE